MKEKVYLGDGVYAQNDGFGIILTTENGICATNTIYLEPDLITKLYDYIQKCANETMNNE